MVKSSHKQSVGKSVTWMFSARLIQAVVQLASAAWVARLLTPSEIGLFAVSFAALLVLNGVRGMGVNQYLLHAKDFSAQRIQSGFTLVFSLGIVLCSLTNLAAGPMSVYYGQPAMAPMLHLLSVNFLLYPFHMIMQTRASRGLDFIFLARVEVLSSLAAAGLTVLLALLGFRYYALAVGTVGFLTSTIVLYSLRYFVARDFRLCRVYIGDALRYGGWIAGSTFVTMGGNALPDLIVGKSLGITAAGLYDRAAAINRLVWDQLYSAIGSVLFPTFASEKNAGDDLPRAYLHRLRSVADFLWPMLAWLVAFGDQAIIFLYGDQWFGAGAAARALAFAAMVSAPFFIARELLFVLGKTRQIFLVDLSTLIVRAAILIVAAPYGIFVMAISFMLPNLIFTLASQVLLARTLGLRFVAIFGVILRPLAMTSIYGAAMMGVRYGLDQGGGISPFSMLALSGALSLATAPVLLAIFRSPLITTLKGFLQRH